MNNSGHPPLPNPSTPAPSKPVSSGTPRSSDMGMSLYAGKINGSHLCRQAIVYVRQSTMHQVLEHRESGDRQYGLVHRAAALGWLPAQVEVIDDDQGLTASTAEGRSGFQRLLVEVSLDHVGIILGLEMSRLARSNKDWHQLLEVCAVFGTLLADQDGVYDPNNHNDRLLLGLKGTISEAELHVLRSRMAEGLKNKARRGEVFNHPPMGYVKLPDRTFGLDPDQQVQGVIRLLFDQFERQGSMHGLLRYLVHHQIKMPIRPHYGPNRGQLEWRRPNRETLQNLLHHPIYAGYYRWGQRTIDPRKKVPGRPATGRTSRAAKDCPVLLEGHCPAYITAQRYWHNQERLAANRTRAESQGAARQGPSLLAGLLVCGRCGRRMTVSYTNAGSCLRYNCSRAFSDYAEPLCQSLSGKVLDELVAAQVLVALEPASLELSLLATADLEQQRQQEEQQWQQRRERAGFQVDRAWRQYNAVEPENRLVGRTLEQQWEQALQAQQELEQEYARFRHSRPAELTAAEREQIGRLARDVPALWQASTTTVVERQRAVRCLVEQVRVRVEQTSECVQVEITWAGGWRTEHALQRPVSSYGQLSGYAKLRQRIEQLRGEGGTLDQIAEQLNEEGCRPPKRCKRFNGAMIARLLSKEKRSGPRPRAIASGQLLGDSEWLLSDLARELSMPSATLQRWRRVGWVQARKLPVAGGHWAIWADEEELERMRRLRKHPRGWSEELVLKALTTPKKRSEK
jgi:DNA invertase Pin-like site-specific DNA recombinase